MFFITSFSKDPDESRNPDRSGWAMLRFISRGHFSFAIFTFTRESNTWVSPAFEPDVTISTTTLFPTEFSALELTSQIIPRPNDWHLHYHCRLCIFCTWNPLKNHVIEPKIFRGRRGRRNYLAQTIYFKAQASATHLGKAPSHSFIHSVNIDGAPSWSMVGTVLDLGAKQWTRGANFFPGWNAKNRQMG